MVYSGRNTLKISAAFALCALVLFFCGCHYAALLSLPKPNEPLQDDSLLLSGRLRSSNSVVLEVFQVRCPYGDPELNTALWKDVDEQVFPVSLRREMIANGFRVGLIGNQLPASFLRILKIRDDENPNEVVTTIRLDGVAEEQHLNRKTVTARNGQRNEVNVSEIIPQATVLFNENGALGGETFYAAQGVLAIKTETCGDGSVDVEFIPEIQYGQARQTFSYEAGIATMATARPKRAFDTLRSKLNILPGQFVVLTSLPNSGGNIGSFFFASEGETGTQQKMICFRVLQTCHNEMYTEDGTLPMDPSETDMEVYEDTDNEEDEGEELE